MEFKIKGKKITNEEKSYLSRLGLKWCSHCKRAIGLNNFNLNSKITDGYCAICRECSKAKRKDNPEYYKQKDAEKYQNKHEELLNKVAQYRATHKEQIKELKSVHYKKNKEKILTKQKEYRQDNFDKIKIQQKEYREKNKVDRNRKISEYRKNNPEKSNAYARERYKNNTGYKLRMVCREMVRRMFDAIHTKKSLTTNQILGYSPVELKDHIEKQFKSGMSWDNYGEWHIDHIIPISLARDLQEGIELSSLKNLQPLWALENILKGNKIEKINEEKNNKLITELK